MSYIYILFDVWFGVFLGWGFCALCAMAKDAGANLGNSDRDHPNRVP